jgi:hypothetical protein
MLLGKSVMSATFMILQSILKSIDTAYLGVSSQCRLNADCKETISKPSRKLKFDRNDFGFCLLLIGVNSVNFEQKGVSSSR